MFGIIMANTPPDAHTGWVGKNLPSTTITDAWAGTQIAFGELWKSTRHEKYTDATMSDANNTKITEEAPSAGSKDSEKDNDATMDDVEENRSTKEI